MLHSKNMKILIITAHPSSKGRTHLIANEYRRTQEEKGNSVELINLYSENNFIPNFSFENIKEIVPTEKIKEIQNKVEEAGEIVFIHPIWWGFMPAIMKNFIDNVFTHGFAYRFNADGSKEKLLSGKNGKVFLTSGGPGPNETSLINIFWKKEILGFVGIEMIDFKVLNKLDMIKDETELNEHINNFLEEVRK